MANFFKKIRNIADAFMHPLPVDEAWYQDRLAICSGCEYNSDNVDDTDKSLVHKLREVANPCPEKRHCTACGCCIDRKTAVAGETCGMTELGMKPKWESIVVDDLSNKGVFIANKNPEVYKLLREGSKFTIDLGKVAQETVSFSFEVHTPKNYIFRNAIAGCGCTFIDKGEIEEGVFGFPIKLSTQNFAKNALTVKAISLYFKEGEIQRVINVQLKVVKI